MKHTKKITFEVDEILYDRIKDTCKYYNMSLPALLHYVLEVVTDSSSRFVFPSVIEYNGTCYRRSNPLEGGSVYAYKNPVSNPSVIYCSDHGVVTVGEKIIKILK